MHTSLNILQNPNLTKLNYSSEILKLSPFSTLGNNFCLVPFQCKRSSQYFVIKQRIVRLFHGNSTVQSIKFASGLINKEAGEKDGEEWLHIGSLDWPGYLLNLKILRFSQNQVSWLRRGRVQNHLTLKNVIYTERKMAGDLYANFASHISL